MKKRVATASLLLNIALRASAFFSPEVPRTYRKGESVPLTVNKLTSTRTVFPLDPYRLPFCQPLDGPETTTRNSASAELAESLVGHRIKSSPYRLTMMEDVFCASLCVTNVGREETRGYAPSKMVDAVRRGGYINNWFVDDLPVVFRFENEFQITTRYGGGFPIGFVGVNGLSYVFNHVNIEIHYHRPRESEPDEAQIVKVIVEPFSIAHKFVFPDYNDDAGEPFVTINNPIESCVSNSTNKRHTEFGMLNSGLFRRNQQLASGKVLFTYDVVWVENPNVPWSSRRDLFRRMAVVVPAQIHWCSLTNSFSLVVLLLLLVCMTLAGYFFTNLPLYMTLESEEQKEELLAQGVWKLLRADVFHPPDFSPLLLSTACGTGAQLVATSFLTLICLTMGSLTSARGGDVALTCSISYALMGIVGGYVSSRLYKTFRGKRWRDVATRTAFLFPSVCFSVLLASNCLAFVQVSTYVLPFSAICYLLVLHVCVCVPLVFCGAYVGYEKEAFVLTANTNSNSRKNPKQPWYMSTALALLVGGILPFSACVVESRLILNAVWRQDYYNAFGILLLVLLMVLIISAGVTVVDNLFRLLQENHQWWWRSFFVSGSVALHLFFYSMYARGGDILAYGISDLIFYAGWMSFACFAVFLMTGYVGFSVTYMINVRIFNSIKRM